MRKLLSLMCIVGLGVMGRTWAGPEPIQFGVKTEHIQISYRVQGGQLELETVACDEWVSPLSGRVFPGNPHRGGNGPRYNGPIEIIAENGDAALEPLYQSHQSETEATGVEHLTVFLRDRVSPIDVELHLRAYPDVDVIEQWMVVKNETKKTLWVPRLDSMYWPASAKKDIFLEWYESHQHNTAAFPIRQKLGYGTCLLESKDGNRHRSGPMPAFVLGFGAMPDEETVPCMIAALDWTGSTRFSFEINNLEILEASVGVNQPGHPTVAPGNALASPACFFTLSKLGKGAASRSLHRWARTHFLPGGERIRLIDNNSWEGCGMKVSEAAIIEMMKDSADLGIELYVLDDGWFGNGKQARVNSKAGLGDWQFNEKRFPNGLEKCMEESKRLGIEFGIWFEPEMINPKSKLNAHHPEWVMRNPGRKLALQRNQMALDVANPAVQRFMFKAVDDVLTAYPRIRFVKWDCNSNINNGYSPYLGATHQGNMLNAYMAGYLKVMKSLVEKHPAVDFQACAAGGGRADLGALRYSHTFWPSDDTDPVYRLGAQWNMTTFLPPLTMTSHVTHKGEKNIKPKFRFDVSMMGQLGMEVDTRKSTAEYLAAAQVGIATYKEVREIVQLGDQYRHAHPYDSTIPSLNYVSPDQTRALVLAYQTEVIKKPIKVSIPVSGLDPKRMYRAVEVNLPEGDDHPRLAPGTPAAQSGKAWMENKIPMVFFRTLDSAAVVLDGAD